MSACLSSLPLERWPSAWPSAHLRRLRVTGPRFSICYVFCRFQSLFQSVFRPRPFRFSPRLFGSLEGGPTSRAVSAGVMVMALWLSFLPFTASWLFFSKGTPRLWGCSVGVQTSPCTGECTRCAAFYLSGPPRGDPASASGLLVHLPLGSTL